MKLKIENDFQDKLMIQSFGEPTTIRTDADIQAWRTAWSEHLGAWHSPYKCLLDLNNLRITPAEDLEPSFTRMEKFLKGFFLRKAAGYQSPLNAQTRLLAFPVFDNEDEAVAELGIRKRAKDAAPKGFRESITIENHFAQHTVELSFESHCHIDSHEKVSTLKSKLANNLTQWHSRWNLLIDCSELEISKDQWPAFTTMLQWLSGFFLKNTVGYGPGGREYPFQTYRSRHRAAAALEGEGAFSGDDANCQSRNPKGP